MTDEARLDISVRGFWTKYQMAFIEVRVLEPNAKRHEDKTLQQYYITNEMEKKQKCKGYVLQVENESSTPLVFWVNGAMGKKTNKCYSRIAKNLAEKWDETYSVMMSWIWKKIFFLMMKSIIMCICQLSMSEKNIKTRN